MDSLLEARLKRKVRASPVGSLSMSMHGQGMGRSELPSFNPTLQMLGFALASKPYPAHAR